MRREFHVRFCEGPGVQFPRATRLVVMCDTKWKVEQAEKRVQRVLAWLGLELHPEKTRKVDLSWGQQSFDFLGCTLRKRLSGPIWERERRRVYFLQREPSMSNMKRVRQKVKDATSSKMQGAKDVRVIIERLNPVLKGRGNHFRTGNAAKRFNQLDSYVWRRLKSFMVRRKGRHLRAGECEAWTRDFFVSHGLHRLRGTVRCPEAA